MSTQDIGRLHYFKEIILLLEKIFSIRKIIHTDEFILITFYVADPRYTVFSMRLIARETA